MSSSPPHQRSRPFRASASTRPIPAVRAAFTLLELMLAMLLGAIIVFSAMGIFALLEKANKHQEGRLERTAEIAVARRTIANALKSLVMGNDAPPRDEELKTRIEQYVLHAESEEGADVPDDDTNESRFVLQPDITRIGPDNRPTQTLQVTVRTAPIVGGMREVGVVDDTGMSSAQIEALLARGERLASFGGVGMKGTDSGDTRSPREKREAKRAAAVSAAETGDVKTATALSTNDPPRAPGFRGLFELRPDAESMDATALVRAREAGDAETWSLWWRELPPDISTSDTLGVTGAGKDENEEDAELLALERQSRSDGREIRLLSGLTSFEWRAYVRKRFIRKINAKDFRELPAYMEFNFTTIDGREEHWMFDLAWTTGQEPGSIVQNTGGDPLLGGGGGIDVASVINDAIRRAQEKEGGGTGDPTTVAGVPGMSPGKTGTGATGGTGSTQVATGGGKTGTGTPGVTGAGQGPYINPGLPDDLWQRILDMERRRNPGGPLGPPRN